MQFILIKNKTITTKISVEVEVNQIEMQDLRIKLNLKCKDNYLNFSMFTYHIKIRAAKNNIFDNKPYTKHDDKAFTYSSGVKPGFAQNPNPSPHPHPHPHTQPQIVMQPLMIPPSHQMINPIINPVAHINPAAHNFPALPQPYLNPMRIGPNIQGGFYPAMMHPVFIHPQQNLLQTQQNLQLSRLYSGHVQQTEAMLNAQKGALNHVNKSNFQYFK